MSEPSAENVIATELSWVRYGRTLTIERAEDIVDALTAAGFKIMRGEKCPNCKGSKSPTWVATPCGMCDGRGWVPAPLVEPPSPSGYRIVKLEQVGVEGWDGLLHVFNPGDVAERDDVPVFKIVAERALGEEPNQ